MKAPPYCGPPAGDPVSSRVSTAATRRGVAFVGVGWMGLAWSPRGLAFIGPPVRTSEAAVQWLDAFSTGPETMTVEAATEPVAAVLTTYFAGEPVHYPGPIDLAGLSPFAVQVLTEVRRIPRGETRTYGWIAGRVGMRRAARAAGRAIGANPLAPLIPCHRVIGANGRLTGYRWGVQLKRWLLTLEGVSPLGE